ncbi:MAG TPA: hypothetical protein VM802_07295 [Chitinophaga sp.]|uniref:hypothetical protein n=1 Tax=Chitinophaga sp. TaxID=1869181 RepID=UPI002CA942CC|nr:hypothetical protein [Chitinophaga sp.]HVI44656.1 hypothetical protein [Chitinophaga sp.]
MKRKQWCWLAIALLHLLVAALSAAHLQVIFPRRTLLAQAWQGYGAYTGASNIFSFFAPEIGDEIAVIYTVVDRNGKQMAVRLENNANHERNTRLINIYGFFSVDEARELMAQSCASYMFSQIPQAVLIRVVVVYRAIPPMQDYRNGQRPRWYSSFSRAYRRNTDS